MAIRPEHKEALAGFRVTSNPLNSDFLDVTVFPDDEQYGYVAVSFCDDDGMTKEEQCARFVQYEVLPNLRYK